MNISIDLQVGDGIDQTITANIPNIELVQKWVNLALLHVNSVIDDPFINAEICLRVVSEQESKQLNSTYRGKQKPTNVLSFESDLPDFVESDYLGDLVICAQIVATQANEQEKNLQAHWTHMVIHGLLHLVGFDHIDDEEANVMETLETEILNQLGIDDPYTKV